MCHITFRQGKIQLRSHYSVHGYLVFISLMNPLSGNGDNKRHCETRYCILIIIRK